MDKTNSAPQEAQVLPPPPHKQILWLLTGILLALEVYQFQKPSLLASAAVLNLCLIIYLHWRPRNVEHFTAMENKVTLRVLTLVLCITILLQLLSHSLVFVIPVGILILIILYLYPKRTLCEDISEIEPDTITPNQCSN